MGKNNSTSIERCKLRIYLKGGYGIALPDIEMSKQQAQDILSQFDDTNHYLLYIQTESCLKTWPKKDIYSIEVHDEAKKETV